MKIKVKKLHEDAVLPRYAHSGDAGMDLYALESTELNPGERKQVRTGVAFEMPVGYSGFIWDKSGLSQKHGLKTLGGVFDGSYRGECIVGIVNLSREIYVIEKGHKVAQMIIQKAEQSEIVEVEELSDSERGAGGFGSTGK